MKQLSGREAAVLSALFFAGVAWSAVNPVHPADWWLEIAVPVLVWAGLAAAWRRFRFTPLAMRLLFVELVILVVGAHYTHEKVPLFDWIRDLSGGSRNHFDRVAHFAVGLLCAIPVREVLARKTPLRGGWLGFVAAVFLTAWGAIYEVLEWWIAVGFAPGGTGAAFLGSQGDPWDAQKDMLLDSLGAVAGLLAWTRVHDRQLEGEAGFTASVPASRM